MTRTIISVPGLGDICWIFQKLINQPEKFNWKIGDGPPQRGHQIFDLFPQLTESFEYIPQSGYKKVMRNGYRGTWGKAPQEMFLEANSWLESGKRIEGFLPDLETSFILPYRTTSEDSITSALLFGGEVTKTDPWVFIRGSGKFIGIYTSAYSNARHWGGWGSKEWVELLRMIKKHNPDYKFVLIGANYDVGIPDEIIASVPKDWVINTVGQPLPVVVEILRRLDCFIGFPSGLSIINETLGARQTVMFYPKHLQKLINTWPDPVRIESGAYKGCVFCEPERIFDWLIKNEKI